MIDLDMVKIPGGKFLMGSSAFNLKAFYDEYPQHLVTMPSFWMSKTTITESQWRFVADLPIKNRVLDKSPSNIEDNYPIKNIKWEEAIEFCDRLSIHTGRKYRLPSEAEWEYACRAGTTTAYFFGDTINENQANFSRMGRENKLMLVGQFPPNDFGLYDMHGNVWEWCQDNWHENYNGAPTDGSAWSFDHYYHVIRGGSYCSVKTNCHSAYRNFSALSGCDIGFRVVCSDN